MRNAAVEAELRFGTSPSVFPSMANIIRVWSAGTPLQQSIGGMWYRNEHDYGRALADTHWRRGSRRTITHALGIMAALSPMVPWDYAKQLALVCYREHGLTGGHYGQFVDKANAIYLGADPRDVLGGPKVRAFYEALGTAGTDPDIVVIDRHALHASIGDIVTPQQRTKLLRQSTVHDGYEFAADAYRRATKVINLDHDLALTPSQVQATTWIVWRDWLLGDNGVREAD